MTKTQIVCSYDIPKAEITEYVMSTIYDINFRRAVQSRLAYIVKNGWTSKEAFGSSIIYGNTIPIDGVEYTNITQLASNYNLSENWVVSTAVYVGLKRKRLGRW